MLSGGQESFEIVIAYRIIIQKKMELFASHINVSVIIEINPQQKTFEYLCSIKRRFLEIPNIRNITTDKANGTPPKIIKVTTKECGSILSD